MKYPGYFRRIISLFILWAIASSCADILPPAPQAESVLAEPIEDLTSDQLKNHIVGDIEFGRIFSQEEGLGPIFVSNSCESCHVGDGKGHPLTTLTRFGRYSGNSWDAMPEQGGPQLQHRAISGYPPEEIPSEATGVTQLMPPAITGLGYLAALSDATILALADPQDANGDGISGVPNYIDPKPYFTPRSIHLENNGRFFGRFGKKAGAIDLRQQVVGAYLQDMGITSDFETEDLFNPAAGVFTGNEAPDPEVPASTVKNVVFYIRTLKAPPRRNADDPNVRAGETIFANIGCASCHTPTLTTAPSDIEALSEKTIHPYTDLLLHDMGAELDDGYTEGTALTSEWRTAPLWGIGLAEDSQGGSPFYLHDGRATTLEAAISFHGGEASTSRENFNNLSEAEKTQLIQFLKSL